MVDSTGWTPPWGCTGAGESWVRWSGMLQKHHKRGWGSLSCGASAGRVEPGLARGAVLALRLRIAARLALRAGQRRGAEHGLEAAAARGRAAAYFRLQRCNQAL